jgi:hypothetical protein
MIIGKKLKKDKEVKKLLSGSSNTRILQVWGRGVRGSIWSLLYF